MRGKKTKTWKYGDYSISIDTNPQEAKLRALKQIVSKKASMANKRLRRLENSNLTSSPAYQQWAQGGSHNFSVKGKSYNELQAELARVNNFINSKTGSVRGVQKVVTEMGRNIGITVKDIDKVQEYSKPFFELASKVEQSLRLISRSASAIGYQKIWEVIDNYVKKEQIDLTESKKDVETMIPDLLEMLSNAYSKESEEDMFKYF